MSCWALSKKAAAQTDFFDRTKKERMLKQNVLKKIIPAKKALRKKI